MSAATIIYNFVSRDAQVALEEFRTEFNGAFMQDTSEQWATELGLEIVTNALKVTLPVPISAAGYRKRSGDRVYRKLSERSFSFTTQVWEDGFAERVEIIEAPEFIGWQQEPANMAVAASNLKNEIISAKLEENPEAWDEKLFFADDHPVNLLQPNKGSFDNNITGAGTNLTGPNIGRARANFRKIKGPNGKPLGVRFLGIVIPPTLEETAREIANASVVVANGNVGATDNMYKGLKFWVSDQLTNDNVWYPIGAKQGMYPWAITTRGAPETLVLGRDSAMFEREGKVGFNSTLQTDGALAFPQLVQRWAGTAP